MTYITVVIRQADRKWGMASLDGNLDQLMGMGGPEFPDQTIFFCGWVVEALSGLVNQLSHPTSVPSPCCFSFVWMVLECYGMQSPNGAIARWRNIIKGTARPIQFCCCSRILNEMHEDLCNDVSAFFGEEELRYGWGEERIGDLLAWQRWCIPKLICKPMHFKNWILSRL